MKRMTAFVMALAMILTLAACGGKADQPSSNNTPPVTQGETANQPDSNPADNSQPSEPDNTPTNEPQNNSGALPEFGYYLYDGEHYLISTNDSENPSCVALTGQKISKDSITFKFVGDYAGSENTATISFGGEGTVVEQISIEGETPWYDTWLTKNLTPGEVSLSSPTGATENVWAINSTDEDKPVSECSPIYITWNNPGKVEIDGQSIETFDDLIDIFGTPTAAVDVRSDVLEAELAAELGGNAVVDYIWQFDKFFVAVEVSTVWGPEGFDIFEIDTIYAYKPSELTNEAMNIADNSGNIWWKPSVRALEILGLL